MCRQIYDSYHPAEKCKLTDSYIGNDNYSQCTQINWLKSKMCRQTNESYQLPKKYVGNYAHCTRINCLEKERYHHLDDSCHPPRSSSEYIIKYECKINLNSNKGLNKKGKIKYPLLRITALLNALIKIGKSIPSQAKEIGEVAGQQKLCCQTCMIFWHNNKMCRQCNCQRIADGKEHKIKIRTKDLIEYYLDTLASKPSFQIKWHGNIICRQTNDGYYNTLKIVILPSYYYLPMRQYDTEQVAQEQKLRCQIFWHKNKMCRQVNDSSGHSKPHNWLKEKSRQKREPLAGIEPMPEGLVCRGVHLNPFLHHYCTTKCEIQSNNYARMEVRTTKDRFNTNIQVMTCLQELGAGPRGWPPTT